MTAQLAVAGLRENLGFISLTPRGWSPESDKLHDAEILSREEFRGVKASDNTDEETDDFQTELRISEQDLLDILTVYRTRISDEVRQQIQKRVNVLIDPDDWDAEDRLPNPESFRRLMSFLAAHRELRQPSLFLNRYGLFTASWRPSKRELTSLVFHADDDVNWLVYSPRKGSRTEVDEAAGRNSLDEVLEAVGRHGALVWMRR